MERAIARVLPLDRKRRKAKKFFFFLMFIPVFAYFDIGVDMIY